MALVACRICRRVFINSLQGEHTCPDCTARLNELYPIVRNFLRDNDKTSFTAYDISKMLGIDLKDIDGLVALGLISTVERHRGDSGQAAPKPLKSRPGAPRETGEIPDRGKTSMHKYRKKLHDHEQQKKGDKKKT